MYKKLSLLIFMLLLASVSIAQTFIECPHYMIQDSLFADTTVTRDFWFNTADDSSKIVYNNGNIDLDIYPRCVGGDADDDTLTIEVYGLKLKTLFADKSKSVAQERYTVFAIDCVRVTSTLAADTLLHSYALDSFWGSDIPLLDGVRTVIKNQGASDGDSVLVDSNIRIYHKATKRWW